MVLPDLSVENLAAPIVEREVLSGREALASVPEATTEALPQGQNKQESDGFADLSILLRSARSSSFSSLACLSHFLGVTF